MSALENHSKFYYGWQITTTNRYIDFNDGAGVKTATLRVGYYSSTDLMIEITGVMPLPPAIITYIFLLLGFSSVKNFP